MQRELKNPVLGINILVGLAFLKKDKCSGTIRNLLAIMLPRIIPIARKIVVGPAGTQSLSSCWEYLSPTLESADEGLPGRGVPLRNPLHLK